MNIIHSINKLTNIIEAHVGAAAGESVQVLDQR